MNQKKVSIVNTKSKFWMKTGTVTKVSKTDMGVMYEVTFDSPHYGIDRSSFFESEIKLYKNS